MNNTGASHETRGQRGRLTELVDLLVRSYNEHDDIIKLDRNNPLNRSVIIEETDKLRCLVFPGFFGKKNIYCAALEYYAGDLLEGISYNLTTQIAGAIRNKKGQRETDDKALAAQAEDLCFQFLKTLPQVRATLATDVAATYDGDPAAYSKDEIISSYPGIYAITVYRLAHVLYELGIPLIPRIMTEHAHSRTGIDIHPGASIGHHFFIDHGTGIVIGQTTLIGNHVKIYQGVTLGGVSTKGGQSLRNKKRHPTIEDNVTIYSGASILGGLTVIGEGAVIGGNAFVTESVPANTRVSMKNRELQYK